MNRRELLKLAAGLAIGSAVAPTLAQEADEALPAHPEWADSWNEAAEHMARWEVRSVLDQWPRIAHMICYYDAIVWNSPVVLLYTVGPSGHAERYRQEHLPQFSQPWSMPLLGHGPSPCGRGYAIFAAANFSDRLKAKCHKRSDARMRRYNRLEILRGGSPPFQFADDEGTA